MQKEELVIVYLTPQQAQEMNEINKRYAFIKVLESLGVFELKNGSVEIHFDSLGRVASIQKHQHYKDFNTV